MVIIVWGCIILADCFSSVEGCIMEDKVVVDAADGKGRYGFKR
jgi:hypothetical protein